MVRWVLCLKFVYATIGGARTWDRLANRAERRVMVSVKDGDKAWSMQTGDSRRLSKWLVSIFCASCDFGWKGGWNAQGVLMGDNGEWKMRRRLREIETCRGRNDVSRRSEKGGKKRGCG